METPWWWIPLGKGPGSWVTGREWEWQGGGHCLEMEARSRSDWEGGAWIEVRGWRHKKDLRRWAGTGGAGLTCGEGELHLLLDHLESYEVMLLIEAPVVQQ